ncbi:cytochrome P450 [Lactarius hatsudake]|nr:cytochrome P450 [Lactarius hatsudake]
MGKSLCYSPVRIDEATRLNKYERIKYRTKNILPQYLRALDGQITEVYSKFYALLPQGNGINESAGVYDQEEIRGIGPGIRTTQTYETNTQDTRTCAGLHKVHTGERNNRWDRNNSLQHRLRRVAVEGFSKSAVRDFHPIQGREALMLALALMKNPSTLTKHLQRHAGSVMLSINYDFPPVDSEDDPVVVRIAKQVERLLHEMQPGARLVEIFTWMKYIPSRFAKWKRDAEYWFIQDSLMYEGLLGKVADDLFLHQANGIDRPSFGATVIQNQSKHDLSKREQAWLVGMMVSAGGDTMSSTLQWWVLAMLAYPEVQTRAHAELDEVVGSARPPTFADLPSLPYIRAMVKETLRWSPMIPLGVPHVSTEDDWYEGMFIPKGTICLQNMHTLNFNPEVFGSNAVDFDPARYLDEKGQVKPLMVGREEGPGHMSFGFGRRICPGRFVAEWTLAIDFATLLWAMRFERPEGVRGELDVHTLVHCGITA